MPTDIKAVLDIGSNTVRLLIAELQQGQHIKRLFYRHHIVRLGEGLQQTGELGEAGMVRAIESFRSLIWDCESYGIAASNIVAVATAAVREATNGQVFVARVADETGLQIQVISGEQEAALALQGARLGLPEHMADEMLLFDIGGGSTEFNRVMSGELVDAYSLKLGVVRLTELYPASNPPTAEEYQRIKLAAMQFLDKLEGHWQKPGVPEYMVGTAGTVTTIAAIAQDMDVYDPDRINGYALSRAHFEEIRDRILGVTSAQRLEIPALEKGREDVIVAGFAILDAMLERWGYSEMISVDSGLLEGLLTF